MGQIRASRRRSLTSAKWAAVPAMFVGMLLPGMAAAEKGKQTQIPATLENFFEVQARSDYFRHFFNSVVISVGSTLIGLLVAVPANAPVSAPVVRELESAAAVSAWLRWLAASTTGWSMPCRWCRPSACQLKRRTTLSVSIPARISASTPTLDTASTKSTPIFMSVITAQLGPNGITASTMKAAATAMPKAVSSEPMARSGGTES